MILVSYATGKQSLSDPATVEQRPGKRWSLKEPVNIIQSMKDPVAVNHRPGKRSQTTPCTALVSRPSSRFNIKPSIFRISFSGHCVTIATNSRGRLTKRRTWSAFSELQLVSLDSTWLRLRGTTKYSNNLQTDDPCRV